MARDDVDLRDLKILRLLLEVGSLTQAAQILGLGQPAVSKALARLRGHFADPLLVRVGGAMRPTPRAAALLAPLNALLLASQSLDTAGEAFDPATARREFTLLLTEVGAIQFAPPLVGRLQAAGPGLALRVLALDTRSFAARLEAGEADLAIGAFPEASASLRRQHLYDDGYLGVARRSHPRLATLAQLPTFLDAAHAAVAASGAGHAPHGALERTLAAALPPGRARLRVPSFLAAAFSASRTDMVATLPARLAEVLAEDLGLATFPPPLTLKPIRVDQLWHERAQHDQGHRWLRGVVRGLFGRETKRSLSAAESPATR
ncbi:MAG TPA: LysR family transcriptional regulator [Caulobacteraceae bacterium]|jgi:DNA-binding transcriptional LysR family regulator|nr:LysR family transcriptional regulator [Caulobacteraceae bacterium]